MERTLTIQARIRRRRTTLPPSAGYPLNKKILDQLRRGEVPEVETALLKKIAQIKVFFLRKFMKYRITE